MKNQDRENIMDENVREDQFVLRRFPYMLRSRETHFNLSIRT